MSEFCTRCVELEARIELMQREHYNLMKELEQKLQKIKDENDALIMDVAFYNGSIKVNTNE
jgi:hypothetical protein